MVRGVNFLLKIVRKQRRMPAMNASSDANSPAFRLLNLRVSPATGRVVGPNGEVYLQPRVMAVLELLARSAGELVTRHQLLEDIWPGGEIYDDVLTQTVYQLRQQLLSAGGTDEYKNLVTTVPKRGYVLNAEVGVIEAEPPSPSEVPRAPRQRRLIALAAAVLIVLVSGWAVFWWQADPGPAVPSARANSVAVLPFLPLVADDRDPVMELGMADTLATRLSGIRELVVRPMSSTRSYADLDRDALKAGRQLRVDAVVDGNLQRSGDTLRVAVRVLRVTDGKSLWAETINAPFSSVFEVQDEISTQIADALALQLGRDDRQLMTKGTTANTAAYQHYLQGRYEFARFTPASMRDSVEHFQAAVELDPEYTQAWLGLANVLMRSPVSGEVPPLEYYPRAIEAARRALELDPDSAEAYAYLGWIAQWYEWDWDASEAYFQRAIELNPNETEAYFGYAHLLGVMGRSEQALMMIRRARELSPNYSLAAALEGGFMMGAGKREEALRHLEASFRLGEDLWLFRIILGSAYFANGQPEEGLAQYEQAEILSGGSTWVVANKLSRLRSMGREGEAEALFNDLIEQSQQRYVPAYDMAVANTAMGDLETALTMLERAVELRDPKSIFLRNPIWSPLRDRPRFIRLTQQLNLPQRSGWTGSGADEEATVQDWRIEAGVVSPSTESGTQVQGHYRVYAPPDTPVDAAPRTGGACLLADLVPFGVGLPTCTTKEDCNSPAAIDKAGDQRLQDFHGYCIKWGEDLQVGRCWTRPGPPQTHCKRSIDGHPLTQGDHVLGPVSADPLGMGGPQPRWIVNACIADEGFPTACGEPESEHRQFSVTPVQSQAH